MIPTRFLVELGGRDARIHRGAINKLSCKASCPAFYIEPTGAVERYDSHAKFVIVACEDKVLYLTNLSAWRRIFCQSHPSTQPADLMSKTHK